MQKPKEKMIEELIYYMVENMGARAKKMAVLHYMSSWDWVGMYFKMVGIDPNLRATS